MNPYIPVDQQGLSDWAANFAALITAAPATYGLVPGDAVTIQNASDDFAAKLTLATDPGTRTPATVADKDASRMSLNGIVRPYALLIRNNAGVTDEAKVALGLTIVDRTPTPIPAPTTLPLISVAMATPLQQTLEYSDATTPTSKAKPFGAIGLQIFAKTSATPITDPTALTYMMTATKSPFNLDWQPADQAKVAYIAARWVTRRGLAGPWSAITAAVVA